MIFTLKKASDCGFKEQVEISSLEELEALQKKYERPPYTAHGWERPELVVDFFEKRIMIYDDYIE